MRIGSTWYDLQRWRAAHPAGTHWIDGFRGRDATDVFEAFHSDAAAASVKRLPRLAAGTPAPDAPAPSEVTLAFRDLRAELVAKGWFRRSYWQEAGTLAPCIALYAAGTALARRVSWLATVLLALGSTAAGWIAHDYVHGRGAFCALMRPFGAVMNGHSATWWSNKHNLHHACTNEVGVDEDIMSDPFFFLWPPDPMRDSQFRGSQHLYALPVYSILFALWRFNSIKTVAAHGRRLWPQALALGVNYLWMGACLPLPVAVGHILLSGLMTATIVTVSHQAEDLLHEPSHDWVAQQIRTTRDAVTSNPFSEWLWGGMQYQLEHHLFPTMPRYRYPALVPKVRALCEAHGLEYRVDSELGVLRRNFGLLRRVAQAPPEPGAPSTRDDEGTVWSRRTGAAWVGSNA